MGQGLMHVLQRADDDAESMDVLVRRFWTAAGRSLIRGPGASAECQVVDMARWARGRRLETPRRG